VALGLYFADPRELLGVPLWEKPLKFLISGGLYSATFSWLYSFVDKGKKFAHLMGNLIAMLLVVEIVVIAGLGASGTTSHFNVSTPFHIAIWSVMATAITGVWVSTFLLGATLWTAPRMASELRLAVRWALGLGLAGMGIAFTMTPPQPQQVLPENWQGIAGAHTVGAADGGPGIPFLGWSSVSGDLRVSHFFGLHALQVLPLLALVLSALIVNYAARVAILRGFAVGYGMLIVITYVQALSGESLRTPQHSLLRQPQR
tara:strand:+ start:3098 stop:3874 length:777 start_codon:yes stop_codon:yes gene_type:complete